MMFIDGALSCPSAACTSHSGLSESMNVDGRHPFSDSLDFVEGIEDHWDSTVFIETRW
jgi:hypothetical protein